MNEHIVARNFGPIRDVSITFRKTTLLIGDQGTGKSCIAKLFSVFKWLEKVLVQRRQDRDYYEKYNRFQKLLEYHQIDSFLREDTYIRYEGEACTFVYDAVSFTVESLEPDSSAICKVMYVPAERSIVSVAENKPSVLRQLPASVATFNDRLTDAKRFFKDGYPLPYGALTFKYDQLNGVSKILGEGYAVFLRNASSGIQSSVPLCLVSDYLAQLVMTHESEMVLPDKMQQWIDSQVREILNNDKFSNQVKESALKNLSHYSFYNSFVNIVEEPELSLFPTSQLEVLRRLVADNTSTEANMLVIATHSPYTLAILNLFIMTFMSENEEEMTKGYFINPNEIAAYGLSNDPKDEYCKSIIDEQSGLISKNALDAVSEEIMGNFNDMLIDFARSRRGQQDGQ